MKEEEKPKVDDFGRALLLSHLRIAKVFLESREAPNLGVGDRPQNAALMHVNAALWQLGENA